MAHDVTLPALGESVSEGTVTRWLKKVGDTVAADEPLLEISTDKVDTEIPSPVAGVLTEILVAEDATVAVGAILARIGAADEAPVDAAPVAAPPVAAPPVAAPPVAAPADAAPVTEPVPVVAPAPAPVADPVSQRFPATAPTPVIGPIVVAPARGSAPSPTPLHVASASVRDVVLPALGESVTQGTVTRWLKKVGDPVAVDEPLLEISTDKVDTEIPSPVAGILAEIVVAEDATVAVGAVLARISAGAANGVASPSAVAPTPPPAVAPAPAPVVASVPASPAPAAPVESAPAVSGSSGYVTPLVRSLAAERGVDLASVAGTGIGGRITKEDVEAAASSRVAPAAPVAAATGPSPSSLRGTTVKMTRLRGIIAERMMESLHGMAQLTTVVEVDMSRVWTLRAKAKDAFQAKENAKLTFLPFFTTAVAESLVIHAGLNASLSGEDITYHAGVNLGIAVDTEKGLIVPGIKNAETLSLADHARAIADLGERARTNRLTPDDLSGGTFTVTNTGSIGALFDTPIVPSPQAAILGTGVIAKKAVVIEGPDGADVITIRPMCYLSLSYDHRIVDGADAARFLQAVRARIEAGAFEREVGL